LKTVEVIQFGVDIEYWTPSQKPHEDYVLSVGWDKLRDFTLLSASSKYPIKIVSEPKYWGKIKKPLVELVGQPTCAELNELYRKARIVAIIMQDSLRPTGQISILQAMSCGRPVVITRTRGEWSDKLVSGKNCIYVPVNDVCAVRDAIDFLWNNPSEAERIGAEARKMVETHYPFEVLSKDLLALF